MNYIELNNQVIIRDENGKYQLNKDKEALKVRASFIKIMRLRVMMVRKY